jgi:hypothetical protein
MDAMMPSHRIQRLTIEREDLVTTGGPYASAPALAGGDLRSP